MPHNLAIKGIVACLVLLTTSYRPCAAAIQIRGVIRHPHRSRVQIKCSFQGTPHRGMTVTVRRRVLSRPRMCRLSLTTCKESINFFMMGPSSVTGFTSEGSVVYTLYQARCQDAGEYVCETVFSMFSSLRRGGIIIDREFLDMYPGSTYMKALPKEIPSGTLKSTTKITINCSVFTTINLTAFSWVWQTRLTTNDSWVPVPKTLWNMSFAPSLNTRCYRPWRTSLAMHVSRKDLGREFQCYVAHVYKGRITQSKPGFFVIREGKPVAVSGSGRRALYVILLVAFVGAIFVLGIVVVMIARSTDFAWVDRRMSNLRRRCSSCLVHRRQRHFSVHRGGGEQPRDSGNVDPQSSTDVVPVVSGAGEAAVSIFSPRAGPADEKTTASPEDDAPGAEDDSMELHFFSSDKATYLPSPLRLTVSKITYVVGNDAEASPQLSLQGESAPRKADSCVALDDMAAARTTKSTEASFISSKESCVPLTRAANPDLVSVGSGFGLKESTKPDAESAATTVKEPEVQDAKNCRYECPDAKTAAGPTPPIVKPGEANPTPRQRVKLDGEGGGGAFKAKQPPSHVFSGPHSHSPTMPMPKAPSVISLPSPPISALNGDAKTATSPSTSKSVAQKTHKIQALPSKISTTTVTLRKASRECTTADSAKLTEKPKGEEDGPRVYAE